jgi:hypothetical protein
MTLSINGSSQIVGNYFNNTGSHGFLLSAGTYTTIDDPSATAGTRAQGINDMGQIVGTYFNATGSHGFLLSAGTYSLGAIGGQGIVDGGVGAAVGIVEEAVVVVGPDDLARAVDAECVGAVGGRGVVQGGVGTIAIEEAVGVVVALDVGPDDLARAVDAECEGAVGGRGVVQGGVDVDWHDTGSSVINPKAEPLSNLLGLSCVSRAVQLARRGSSLGYVNRTRLPCSGLSVSAWPLDECYIEDVGRLGVNQVTS